MSNVTIVLLVILAVVALVLVVLYFIGKKAQKKQAEQEEAINAAKQTVSMLVIDKKKMRLKDAGLPSAVLESTPKLLRGSKVPVVKAKIGPQIMSFICDDKIFDMVPTKREVKATISGLYLVGIKGAHGKGIAVEPKKKSRFSQWKDKLQQKAGAKPL